MPAPVGEITRFPFGVSSYGMPVIGGGGVLTTGQVLFVSSTAAGGANDTQHGFSPQLPFKTLAYALGQTTANQGDLILVMPGHQEDVQVAGGLAFNNPGVRVMGLGVGRNRPAITLRSTTAADVDFNAANIAVENLRFDLTGIDAIAAGLDVNAADVALHHCEIVVGTASAQAVVGLVTDSQAHRLRVVACQFVGADVAGTTAVVDLAGTPDGVEIRDCVLEARTTGGLIRNQAANLATNVAIHRNVLTALGSGPAIALASAVTGVIADNRIQTADLATALDGGAAALVENYGYDRDVADVPGVLLPAVGTSLGAGRSLADEVLGASLNYNRLNYLAVEVDGTDAAWNTEGTHTLLTVTGTVRVRLVIVCTDSLTSAGAAQIQLGHAEDTAAFIGVTVAAGITTGDLWASAASTPVITHAEIVDCITRATAIGYEIQVAALDGGALTVHAWWEPLDADGLVTAGDGSAL